MLARPVTVTVTFAVPVPLSVVPVAFALFGCRALPFTVTVAAPVLVFLSVAVGVATPLRRPRPAVVLVDLHLHLSVIGYRHSGRVLRRVLFVPPHRDGPAVRAVALDIVPVCGRGSGGRLGKAGLFVGTRGSRWRLPSTICRRVSEMWRKWAYHRGLRVPRSIVVSMVVGFAIGQDGRLRLVQLLSR